MEFLIDKLQSFIQLTEGNGKGHGFSPRHGQLTVPLSQFACSFVGTADELSTAPLLAPSRKLLSAPAEASLRPSRYPLSINQYIPCHSNSTNLDLSPGCNVEDRSLRFEHTEVHSSFDVLFYESIGILTVLFFDLITFSKVFLCYGAFLDPNNSGVSGYFSADGRQSDE